MKALACVLGLALSLSVGFIFGRAQGVIAVQTVFTNSCDKLQGLAIGSKVYECKRVKKGKDESN